MKWWRLAAAAILLIGFGIPLGMPLLDLAQHGEAWRAWAESGRLFGLAWNTLRLVAGTLIVAVPLGVCGAVLLYRSDLPGSKALRFLTILTLFVPLPLFASAWQAALGTGGWLPLPAWSTPPQGDPDVTAIGIGWKPWALGINAAVWVHAVAGLPWVVWIVGQGLSWVERELEEDALLVASPLRVLWLVTLPRCRAAILAATLWVALQTATEITVTDVMQVRTFAEEVYTQYVMPQREPGAPDDSDVQARAVAVNVPLVAVIAVLVVGAAQRWERSLPPLESVGPPRCLLRLGASRWPLLAVVLTVVGVLLGVPLASLVWKAGLSGKPETWSAVSVVEQMERVQRVNGRMLAESLGLGFAAGGIAAVLALLCAWLAVESPWFRTALLVLIAVAWAMPGPVLGMGMKAAINWWMVVEERVLGGPGPVYDWLYTGPSPLPILWASLVRFFPCAVAVLWPVVRLLPAELRDAARVDGARPRDELWHVTLPLTWTACARAGLAVGVLSLGELSAGKLVETPGSETFAHHVFNQMHYGISNHLAALCLVLLVQVGVGAAALALLGRWHGRGQISVADDASNRVP